MKHHELDQQDGGVAVADDDAAQDHGDEHDADVDASAREDINEADLLLSDWPLATRVEALLMSTDRALPEKRLADLLGIPAKGHAAAIRKAIDELNASYQSTGRSFRVEQVAGGVQILTIAEFGPLLARLHADRQSSRLSPAALETLSIIAYRQPIMRAELEAIRGVACGEVLRSLLERRLVKVVGRAEELGRPMLYGTTREFLKVFGLANLDDLPAVAGLERKPSVELKKAKIAAAEDAQASADESSAE